MATYRVENLVLVSIDLPSATIQFDVERLDTTWVLVKTATTSVATSSSALEIAKAIGDIAKQIAIKDALTSSKFADVVAVLSGKEFEV